MTDRNSGGTSRKEGTLEIMLERKILGFDTKGVVEELKDTALLEIKHQVKICLDQNILQCEESLRKDQILVESRPLISSKKVFLS